MSGPPCLLYVEVDVASDPAHPERDARATALNELKDRGEDCNDWDIDHPEVRIRTFPRGRKAPVYCYKRKAQRPCPQ